MEGELRRQGRMKRGRASRRRPRRRHVNSKGKGNSGGTGALPKNR